MLSQTSGLSGHYPHDRDSEVFLQRGEYLFFYFPKSVYKYGDKRDPTSRTMEGKLAISSRSLVFVPFNEKYSVIRLPLRNCSTIKESKRAVGGFSRKMYSSVLLVHCHRFVEYVPFHFSGRENEIPEIDRKVTVHVFAFPQADMKEILTLLHKLQSIDLLPGIESEKDVQEVINEFESSRRFDDASVLLEDEKVVYKIRAHRIHLQNLEAGNLVVTTQRLIFYYFSPHDKNYEPFLLTDVKRILRVPFLQHDTGLEVYFHSRPSVLFAFTTPEGRDRVYKHSSSPDLLRRLSTLHSVTQYTDDWVEGRLTNYDYLMMLNIFSGRSLNCISQYPIFPWVLNELGFGADTLDLEDTRMYRDLSKPIGVLKDVDEEELRNRERRLGYHHQMHFSTANVVVSYLMRRDPSIGIHAGQDKGFEFLGLERTWVDLMSHDNPHVVEMIPELFSGNGGFLVSKMDPRKAIDGSEYLRDVALPRWAHDSYDFIRRHRYILESPYVSSKLHAWIDLIFGYKQRGDPARDALNLFHPDCYEISKDALRPFETRSQLARCFNRGYHPKQLFRSPHPIRKIRLIREISSPHTPAVDYKEVEFLRAKCRELESEVRRRILCDVDVEDLEDTIVGMHDHYQKLLRRSMEVHQERTASLKNRLKQMSDRSHIKRIEKELKMVKQERDRWARAADEGRASAPVSRSPFRLPPPKWHSSERSHAKSLEDRIAELEMENAKLKEHMLHYRDISERQEKQRIDVECEIDQYARKIADLELKIFEHDEKEVHENLP